MSLQDRIESLKAKHAALETAIDAEVRRPLPDDAHIADLKRQKLRIKDELSRMGLGPTH
ncbi:MAG: YdcH family protein [Pseudomonadota bacterium]